MLHKKEMRILIIQLDTSNAPHHHYVDKSTSELYMTTVFISLAVIALVAALAPVIVRLIPHQIVPETVLLITAGAVLGPNLLGVISVSSEAITILSDLGCAFLFLLAGYEIEPDSLSGSDGKNGLVTWLITFAIAIGFTLLVPEMATGLHGFIATSLLFTTTALGTLIPILKERALIGTRVGDLIVSYGTWGELAPVLAMAILLSTRSTWQTAVILLAFAALCLLIASLGTKARKEGHALYRFLVSKAQTTSQTMMRLTVLMLISLITFSAIFKLDIMLGAFAAGFIMRFLAPDGAPILETKLDGIAYGFFIPLFFVVSGCKIDLSAVLDAPLLLVLFILGLILVRCVPIIVSLSIRKKTRDISMHNRLSTAFYCTTALPLIVAITSLAVSGSLMETSTASVLVAAGALTVFLMPLLGAFAYRVADTEPLQAFGKIIQDPHDMRSIIHGHIQKGRERAQEYKDIASQRIQKSLDDLDEPEELDETQQLIHRHFEEVKNLRNAQKSELKELYKNHHDEHSTDA